MFCQPGELPPTFETHWNRQGHGKHLTQAQAQGRVCRFNSRPGCLNLGVPQPVPEPLPEGWMNEDERSALADEIFAEIGGEYDAA
jgi:hypothetical protein